MYDVPNNFGYAGNQRMSPNENKDRKTIGLIGLYRCGNLGDEAIWQAFTQELGSLIDSDIHQKMITFGPGGFESAYIPDDQKTADRVLHRLAIDDPGARKINWGFWVGQGASGFFKTLSTLQAAWYAGGHWIHDISKTTLAGIMLPLFWAHHKGSNAGFVNVGAGPLDSAFGKWLVAKGLGANGPLIVRDEHSAAQIEKTSTQRKAVVAADTAFLLDPPSDDIVDRALEILNLEKSTETIGVVPCAWFKMADLYQTKSQQVQTMIRKLAELLRKIDQKGFHSLLIPTMLPEDESVCKAIIKQAGQGRFSIAPTRRFTARTLMGIIGRLRALVSFRMHPVLFAAKMRTPFVAMNYAPKLESLVAQIGCSKWLVDLDDRWPETLQQKLGALLSDKDPFCDATPTDKLEQNARMGIFKAVETLKK